jgi:hypothetical protein
MNQFPEPSEEEITRVVKAIQLLTKSTTGVEITEAKARELFSATQARIVKAMQEATQ